jgi:hypothetical protein
LIRFSELLTISGKDYHDPPPRLIGYPPRPGGEPAAGLSAVISQALTDLPAWR